MNPATITISLFIISISLTSAATTNNAVIDIDGKNVQPGVSYYILPFMRGNGGGLALASRNNSTPCPLTVAQENQEVSRGLPVKFFPLNNGQLVTVSTDTNVEFQGSTVCVQSTVWKLGNLNEETGRRYVEIGGQKGNPGVQTISNWFKIVKVDGVNNVYNMVFCPTVCNFCRVICGDLGVFREDEKRWLGLNSDKPLSVFFKRAD